MAGSARGRWAEGVRPARRWATAFLLATVACLSDRVVTPTDPLPGVLAVDKPTIQFVRFALGRRVESETVHIGNNGDASLGTIALSGEVTYITRARTGWLTAEVIPVKADSAILMLRPTYVDTAGGPPDTAQVTIQAAGAQVHKVVTVVARTVPGAHFEFSANPVTFASLPGGPATATQTFSVRNGGNGTLPIYPPRFHYLGPETGWLAAGSVAGSDPLAPGFDLTATIGTLSPGLHTGYAVFESPAQDSTRAPADSFLVQTRIGVPRVGVSSGLVNFTAVRGGTAVAPQAITITNTGEGTFAALGVLSAGAVEYIPGQPTGWLSASVTNDAVVVAVTPTGLPADTLTAKIPVLSDNGGSATLTVTLEVRLPGLTLSARTLSFNAVDGGTSPPARAVTISNSGSGTLATLGTLGVGAVAFQPGQPSGWVAAMLQDSTLTVTPALGRLPAGTYSATVPVTSVNGGDEALAVTFSVARATDPPVLTLSTTALTLSGTRGDPGPPTQSVAVTNTGGGSLGPITIGSIVSSGGPWLAASVSGTTVKIDAATGSLAPGTYTGSVGVTSQPGGTATIGVTFTVVPVLTLSALTASFGATEGAAATPAAHPITIANTGSGSIGSLGTITLGNIGYGPGQPTGWLTAARTGTTVTLAATTGSLPAGLYTATVPVATVNGGSQSIAVTLSVVPPVARPVLALSTTSLSFSATVGGGNPAGQTVGFFNSGGGVDADVGAVTATIPGSASWLSRTIGAATIGFSVAVGGLPAGLYTAIVPIASAAGGTTDLTVTVTVSATAAAPILAVSSGAVSFTAEEGSTAPASQVVAVVNAGGGSLGTVTVGSPTYAGTSTGWLGASYNAGTGDLTLSAATAALPPGTSTATFDVSTTPTIAGSPVTVTVSLTVVDAPRPAVLTGASAAASFSATEGGGNPGSQSIALLNTGGGGLAALGTLAVGTISYAPTGTAWLTTASINPGTGLVSLQPATGSLAPGLYHATVPITAAGAATGSPTAIAVSFTVSPPNGTGPDEMTLSSHAVSFAATAGGGSPAAQTVTVSNTGTGGIGGLGTLAIDSVTYTGSVTGWLTTASINATSGAISLQPTTGSLTAAVRHATVWVSGTTAGIGSPQTIAVAFTVAAAAAPSQFALATQSASFTMSAGGSTPSAQSIDVLNNGGGSLGTITVGAVTYGGTSSGWLTASYNATADAVVLSLAAGGPPLPEGSSTGTFTVTAAGAGSGSPRTVTGYLSVGPAATPPALTLSSQSLSFAATPGGPAPATQAITITNTGGGSLGAIALGGISYTGGATGWLTRTLTSGGLTLGAVPTGIGAGSYRATFPLSSRATGVTGSPATVTVDLTVAPSAAPPVLTLSTQAVSFATQAGGSTAAQTVTAINTGGGTLASLGAITTGAISYGGLSSGWLGATVTSGTGVVTLTATTAALPSGTSTASLAVHSALGGSSSLTVTLTVASANSAPVLTVSATTVAFDAIVGGAAPVPQTVTISNTGGGTLSGIMVGAVTFGPGQPTGWLATPTSGAGLTTSVTFTTVPGGLAAGVYTAAVPITSSGGSTTIAVTLRVEAPTLTLSTRSASFAATQGTTDPPPQAVAVSNTGVGTQASLGAITLGAPRYRAGEPTGWLTAQAAGATIAMDAHLGSLPSGSFTARLPVVSTFGGSDTVTVTFTVAPGAAPPVLAVSATVVSFNATVAGANPPDQLVAVSNAGGQTLGTVSLGTVAPAAPWLTATLTGTQVRFAVDITGLPAGAYAATVPLETTRAGHQNIGVTLTVGAPRIALSARQVTFGDTAGSSRTLSTDVFVSNGGAGDQSSLGPVSIGTIRYADQTATGWLRSPTSGTTLGTPVVALSAGVGSLPPSTYTAFVPVVSLRGGADTITVQMTVNRPDPAFDQPSIGFFVNDVATDSAGAARVVGDTAQFAVRVRVGNPNNTAIGLSGLRVEVPTYLQGGTGWITGAFLDKTSAPFGAPAELLVALKPSGLPVGRHRAEIPIRSNVAKNSPKRLIIVLTITQTSGARRTARAVVTRP